MYVKFHVSVRAPVILLPCTVMASSAIMIDLGNILLSNEADEVETDIVIDRFSLMLKNFKLSRYIIIRLLSGVNVNHLAQGFTLREF